MAKKGNQYAVGNPGRPESYEDSFVLQADLYLEECKDKVIQGKQLIVNLPTIEGFSEWLEVAVSTLLEWSKKHPEFSKALEKIKHKQKKRLLNMGLSGMYNPTIAKLILSSNHGMSEKTENTLKGGLSLTQLLQDAKKPDTPNESD